MGSQARFRVLVLVFLLAVTASAPLLAVPAAAGGAGPVAADAQDAPDEPRVTVDVRVAPDESARWNVSARFALDSANETRAFDRLAAEFENGTVDAGFSLATFETMAAEAVNRTGREMAIEQSTRRTHVIGESAAGNATGVLSLEFTWTNFASTTDPNIEVGDVFESWQLGADQRLVIYPPENYRSDDVSPGPDRVRDRGLVWDGPLTFGPGEPAVGYEVGSPRTSDPTTSPPGESFSLLSPPVLAGAGLLVAVLALVVVLSLRSPDGGSVGVDPTATPAADSDGATLDGDGGAAATAGEPASDAPPDADDRPTGDRPDDADPDAADDADPDAADDADGPVDDTDEPAVDPDLLSDEERVKELLERNDGRMRQADIVTETGWSNAKVSQLLSSMADEGRVEKLRMGRENLISLDGNGFQDEDGFQDGASADEDGAASDDTS